MNSGSRRKGLLLGLVVLAAGGPAPAFALQAMNDEELASVQGRDGLNVDLRTQAGKPISATKAEWQLDGPLDVNNFASGAGNTHPTNGTDLKAALRMVEPGVMGVGMDGASAGGSTSIGLDMDYYQSGGNGGMRVSANWDRTRLQVHDIVHSGDTTNTYGSFAMDSSGSVEFRNHDFLLNSTASNAGLQIKVNNGQAWYRQNQQELILNNLNVNLGFHDGGTIGVSGSDGLIINAPVFNWDLAFDNGFRSNATDPYTLGTAGNTDEYRPLLRYGWAGDLTDFRVTIDDGGLWYQGDTGNRSDGIHISWRNNYRSNFEWLIGEAGGDPLLKFGAWTKLPNNTFAMNVPNLTLDVVNANQGPPGFAYDNISGKRGLFYTGSGDQYKIDVPGPALAVAFRDVGFHAYNTKVTLIDSPDPTRTYKWGLIYTLGNLDADLVMYPGTHSTSEGLRFDALVGLKSPGDWTQNSHFMIADTGKNTGVGFVNTQFLVEISNAEFLLEDSSNGSPAGIRLNTNEGVRWEMEALFGGGDIDALGNPVKFSDLSLVLEASEMDLLFYPPPAGSTEHWVGYEYDMLLNSNSTITLAEPSRPDVRFTIGNITGSVSARNGRIQLASNQDTADGVPRLQFEQDLLFGLTAGSATVPSQAIEADNFSIGPRVIGDMAIPGGRWRGEFALKEQNPP